MEKTFVTRHEKTKRILDNVVKKILDGGAVKYVRESLEMFTDGEEIPCQKWSRLNRLLVSLEGTNDARGIRQWNDVGRNVKRGVRAFYIFVPMFRTEKDEATEEEQKFLSGFRLMPVFKVEDTDGKELPYQARMKKLDIEKLPLIDVARKLGVTVGKGIRSDGAAGCYRPNTKEILLCSSNPQVFLHELSHAVDNVLGNGGEDYDYALGEVVAELSSAFLGSLYGVKVDLENTKAYIQGWAGKEHVMFKVLSAISRVEEIYRFIEKSRSEIEKEKKPVKRKVKIPEKDGSNYILPFKMEDFKERSQIYNARNGKWVKRDMATGKFTAVKKDGKPWSRVKVETRPFVIPKHDYGTFPPAA